jgi:hypothetical protein
MQGFANDKASFHPEGGFVFTSLFPKRYDKACQNNILLK